MRSQLKIRIFRIIFGDRRKIRMVKEVFFSETDRRQLLLILAKH